MADTPKRGRGRPASGRRRPEKMQACFDEAEVVVLGDALGLAHARQAEAGVPQGKRISPSLLISLLAAEAAKDRELVARVAEQHAEELRPMLERIEARRGRGRQ